MTNSNCNCASENPLNLRIVFFHWLPLLGIGFVVGVLVMGLFGTCSR